MVQLSPPEVTTNRGMGPPWSAFCQITLTSCWHFREHCAMTYRSTVGPISVLCTWFLFSPSDFICFYMFLCAVLWQHWMNDNNKPNVTQKGATLQRPYQIRHFIRCTTGRKCKGLVRVCAVWVVLFEVHRTILRDGQTERTTDRNTDRPTWVAPKKVPARRCNRDRVKW